MTYFWVSAYDKHGDYEYYVFVETKEEIPDAIAYERDEHELSVKIHEITGPFGIGPRTVICGKQPG